MTLSGTIGGRYRLGGRLGKGGMAEVRLGLDVQVGRAVAIKLLLPELARDADVRARFQSEARSVASLNHPNIVRVLDTGEDVGPLAGASTPYIVMELVAGKTLRTLLRAEPRMSPRRGLRIAEGVLAALEQSHAAGIVHQDIKPGNVMLTDSGEVKVMDFGIARNITEAATMVPMALLGTPKYLSPELARGQAGDARSDIYSTGCLLYEILVGRPPFVGSSRDDIVHKHLEEAPLPPSSINPRLSPDVDRLVLKSLAKDPEGRYQSAREMNADVRGFLTGARALVVSRQAPKDVPGPVAGLPTGLTVRRPTFPVAARVALPSASLPAARRRRALVSSGLAAVLVAVGGLALNAYTPAGMSNEGSTSAVLGMPDAEAREINSAQQTVSRSESSPSPTRSAPAQPSRSQLRSDDVGSSGRVAADTRSDVQGRGADSPPATGSEASGVGSSRPGSTGPGSGVPPYAPSPVGPSSPTRPEPTTTPTGPAPAKPSSPAPAKPSSPAPAKPSSPAPAKPSNPPPAKPSNPAPAKPSKPAKPPKPTKPTRPDRPNPPPRGDRPDRGGPNEKPKKGPKAEHGKSGQKEKKAKKPHENGGQGKKSDREGRQGEKPGHDRGHGKKGAEREKAEKKNK